jgi:hypothetical protein
VQCAPLPLCLLREKYCFADGRQLVSDLPVGALVRHKTGLMTSSAFIRERPEKEATLMKRDGLLLRTANGLSPTVGIEKAKLRVHSPNVVEEPLLGYLTVDYSEHLHFVHS